MENIKRKTNDFYEKEFFKLVFRYVESIFKVFQL